MLDNASHFDVLVIGAGIIGLSVARELLKQNSKARIAILEKEAHLGFHASGRNSGVLHSGIYYAEGSLKAAFCLRGSREMAAFCEEYNLPLQRTGKLILPGKPEDEKNLELLHQRACLNGAKVTLVDQQTLREIEPEAVSATGSALFSPETAVVDPKAILLCLYQQLLVGGVRFFFGCSADKIDIKQKTVTTQKEAFAYGHLFNTAGLQADLIAKQCELAQQYTMIPFKGLYYELAATAALNINHLIYPVPDMNVPFLGIHFTKSIDGTIYLGPTAIPAFGREHYRGLQGVNMMESLATMNCLSRQYVFNRQGFRLYAHQEIARFMKHRFIKAAQSLVPRIGKADIIKSAKVGIRPQLYDKQSKALVMDFLVIRDSNETHVLNTVSPGFTSAFSFSKFIVHGNVPA